MMNSTAGGYPYTLNADQHGFEHNAMLAHQTSLYAFHQPHSHHQTFSSSNSSATTNAFDKDIASTPSPLPPPPHPNRLGFNQCDHQASVLQCASVRSQKTAPGREKGRLIHAYAHQISTTEAEGNAIVVCAFATYFVLMAYSKVTFDDVAVVVRGRGGRLWSQVWVAPPPPQKPTCGLEGVGALQIELSSHYSRRPGVLNGTKSTRFPTPTPRSRNPRHNWTLRPSRGELEK
ncbi:unnamed protein product [Mesocestoides corti]|uniref:Homeobox domain-containing protein n=1 Tax=Mesocestoides corti TaxID=53468 RepID=A0A0R3U893_MESCO|nr:unnamed protein product [Mesocestoides corti]